MAWAFAAADVLPSGAHLFERPDFVERVVELERDFSRHELCQLHQWQLWLSLEPRSSGWPQLPSALQRRCYASFHTQAKPSRQQRQVMESLRALGLSPREEVRTRVGYSVDAMVSLHGREVAIEVDGPSHFVRDTRTPNGATTLKRRQLRAAGYTLLPVPYWEWRALDHGGEEASGGGSSDAVRRKREHYLAESLAYVLPRGMPDPSGLSEGQTAAERSRHTRLDESRWPAFLRVAMATWGAQAGLACAALSIVALLR